jgi:hypothetical protein
MPWVWRHGDWQPGGLIDLHQSRQQSTVGRLVERPEQYAEERRWHEEGFLGQLISADAGRGQLSADSELVKTMEMLTFYQALPPPNFRRIQDQAVSYRRTVGDALDLTHLTQGRRLILIGHIKNQALPAPLTADSEAIDGRGWTVVRWVHDFEGGSPTETPRAPRKSGR